LSSANEKKDAGYTGGIIMLAKDAAALIKEFMGNNI
jgi:hypothetical protein